MSNVSIGEQFSEEFFDIMERSQRIADEENEKIRVSHATTIFFQDTQRRSAFSTP